MGALQGLELHRGHTQHADRKHQKGNKCFKKCKSLSSNQGLHEPPRLTLPSWLMLMSRISLEDVCLTEMLHPASQSEPATIRPSALNSTFGPVSIVTLEEDPERMRSGLSVSSAR